MHYQYMSLGATIFLNLFTWHSEIRDHITRLFNHIQVQYRKTYWYGVFFKGGPRYWDELPEHIKMTLNKDRN